MTETKQPSTARMRYCAVCGEELGIIELKHYDSEDTCGKPECEREIRDAMEHERAEAHERLDRDFGYY